MAKKKPSLDVIVASAADFASRQIRTGFITRDEAVNSTEYVLEYDEYPNDRKAESSRIVEEAIDALIQDQESWPALTDCDRLDRAFENLKESGILARQHYSCCGTCAVSEIDLELDHARKKKSRARGYCMYNVQDTEGAVEGGGLFLAYGDSEHTDEGSIEIGHEICRSLEPQGLNVLWDGDLSKKIAVKLAWQRRWPPRSPDCVPEVLLKRSRKS